MLFPPFRIPVPLCDESNPGTQLVVTAAAATTMLAHGFYLIAAEDQPLKWKLGATAVTPATGSFLAAGDQVVIEVPADATTLSVIRAASAAADGVMALNPAVFKEIATQDPRVG